MKRLLPILIALISLALAAGCTGHSERYVARQDITTDDTHTTVHAGDTVMLDYKSSTPLSLVTDLSGRELGHADRSAFKPLEVRGRIGCINEGVAAAFSSLADKAPAMRKALHLPDDAHANAWLFLWLSLADLVLVICASAAGKKEDGHPVRPLALRLLVGVLLFAVTVVSTAVLLNQFAFGDDWNWFLKPGTIGWLAAIAGWLLTAICVGVEVIGSTMIGSLFPGKDNDSRFNSFFNFGMWSFGIAVAVFIFGALCAFLQSWIDIRYISIIMWWIPTLLVVAAAVALLIGFTFASDVHPAAMPMTFISVLCGIIMAIGALLLMSVGILLVVIVAIIFGVVASAVSPSSSPSGGSSFSATDPATGRRHRLTKISSNVYRDTSNGERYRKESDGSFTHIK